MDIPGPVELIIIAGVIMVLFGSKKMPDAARSLGRSMRIFKAETRGLRGDDDAQPQEAPVAALEAAPAPAAVAPAAVSTAELPDRS